MQASSKHNHVEDVMEKTKLTKSNVIRRFFAPPEVKNAELMEFVKADKEGYEWMAIEAAKQLGAELKVK